MKTGKHIATMELTRMGFGIAFLAICSWITIPSTVPFTLQTLGIFLTLIILGGMYGTITILGYLLLGCVGLPVFSGFSGGIGVVLGPTGGYIIGFLATGIVFWLLEVLLGKSMRIKAVSLIMGLAVCYLFGTLWFVRVYSATNSLIGFKAAILMCVVPFLAFDLGKLVVAILVGKRVLRILQYVH